MNVIKGRYNFVLGILRKEFNKKKNYEVCKDDGNICLKYQGDVLCTINTHQDEVIFSVTQKTPCVKTKINRFLELSKMDLVLRNRKGEWYLYTDDLLKGVEFKEEMTVLKSLRE